jgi:hypothetical protein
VPLFEDPLRIVSFQVHETLALDLLSSTMTDLVFVDWTGETASRLFVHVVPIDGAPALTEEAWEERRRAELPPEVPRVETRRVGPHTVILVERPGRDGRPDQRWAIVRGVGADVVLEHVGVPPSDPLLTPVLAEAVRDLRVPFAITASRPGDAEPGATWHDAMADAERAMRAGDETSAVSSLRNARSVALDAWTRSLAMAEPDMRYVLDAVVSLLALAEITGDLRDLADATDCLLRTRAQLAAIDGDPDLMSATDVLVERAMSIHGELGQHEPPRNLIAARHALATVALDRATRSARDDPVAAGGDAFVGRCAATTLAGWTAAQPALAALRPEALRQLLVACSIQDAVRAALGVDASLGETATRLMAARALHVIQQDDLSRVGLILALQAEASSRRRVGDIVLLTESSRLLDEAVTLLEPTDDAPLRAEVHLGRAWSRYECNEPAAADADLDVVLAAARAAGLPATERSVHSLRALLRLKDDRADDAVKEAALSLAEDDDAESAHRLTLANALHAAGRSDEATEQALLGLRIAVTESPLGELVMRFLTVLAEIRWPTDRDASLAATEVAELVLDAQRLDLHGTDRIVAFEDAELRREIVGRVVSRRLEVGDVYGALAAADRGRARTLSSSAPLMMEAIDDSRSPNSGALAAASTTVDGLVAFVADRARERLRSAGVPEPLTGEQLVRKVAALARPTLLLHPTADQLISFLLLPGQPPAVVTWDVSSDALVAKTERLRHCLGIGLAARSARGEVRLQLDSELIAAFRPDQDDVDEELASLRIELFQWIFTPVALPVGLPIAVVPYRELAAVPLAILLASPETTVNDQRPVSVVPSIASLPLSPPSVGGGRALVVGNPATAEYLGLAALEHAAQEAHDVANLLRNAGLDAGEPLVADQATETAVRDRASGLRVLHLACHASLRDPASESALYLSPSADNDGIVRAKEIEDLVLDDALVVLSACQSGLGRVTSDGIQGLGRAFQRAGARAVILSLWSVGDEATSVLMREFYSALTGQAADVPERLDAAAALAHAQRATRREFGDDPSAWGAWLLVGDGGWRVG